MKEDFKEEIKISRLTVYPLKSCKGIDVKRARLTETGFEWDRCFCVIDKDGEFISQRTVPELALVETEFRGAIFEDDEEDDDDDATRKDVREDNTSYVTLPSHEDERLQDYNSLKHFVLIASSTSSKSQARV